MFRPEKKGRRKPQIRNASSSNKKQDVSKDSAPSANEIAEKVIDDNTRAETPLPASPPSLKRNPPSNMNTEDLLPQDVDLNVIPLMNQNESTVSREEVMKLLGTIRPSYSLSKLKVKLF